MKQSLLALSLLFTVASCEKTEPAKASEPLPTTQTAPVADSPTKKELPPAADTPEDLKELQGKLPRMDPEKAKFIAVPSTPPDPKPATKPSPAETIVKAVPTGAPPEPPQTK
jgi:hypothetical protein